MIRTDRGVFVFTLHTVCGHVCSKLPLIVSRVIGFDLEDICKYFGPLIFRSPKTRVNAWCEQGMEGVLGILAAGVHPPDQQRAPSTYKPRGHAKQKGHGKTFDFK